MAASSSSSYSDCVRLSNLWWALLRVGRAGQGRAVGVLSIWILVDRFLDHRWQLRQVRPGGVFRYRMTRYSGRTVTLDDGTSISRGDPLVELHFNNRALMGMTEARDWSPWSAMELMDQDLATLATSIASGALGPVRALHGVTLFAAPGRRLGFEVHEVPHTWGWSLERFFLIGLIPIYHRDGWREFDRMRRDRWPGVLWMSVGALLRRGRRKSKT